MTNATIFIENRKPKRVYVDVNGFIAWQTKELIFCASVYENKIEIVDKASDEVTYVPFTIKIDKLDVGQNN